MNIKQRAFMDVIRVCVLAALVGSAVTVSAELVGVDITYGVVLLVAAVYFARQAYLIRVDQLTAERDRIERSLKR